MFGRRGGIGERFVQRLLLRAAHVERRLLARIDVDQIFQIFECTNAKFAVTICGVSGTLLIATPVGVWFDPVDLIVGNRVERCDTGNFADIVQRLRGDKVSVHDVVYHIEDQRVIGPHVGDGAIRLEDGLLAVAVVVNLKNLISGAGINMIVHLGVCRNLIGVYQDRKGCQSRSCKDTLFETR